MAANKLTIVHVVDSCGMYGKEHVIFNLVKEQQNDFNIVVIDIGNNHQLTMNMAVTNATCVLFQTKRGFSFKDAKCLRQVVASYKPNVIHVHDYKSSVYVAPHLSRSNAHIVRTLHGHTSTTFFSRGGLIEMADNICLGFNDVIVGVSPQQRGLLSQCDVVIRNGIPSALPPNEQLDDTILEFCDKQGEDIKVLCAIGRLSDEKNHKMLISAISKSKRRGRIKLLIFGNGKLYGHLFLQIKDLGLEDDVYLAGFHPNAAEYLSTTNIEGHIIDGLIQPSKTEGTPITILEAFRANVPVLASSVGDMIQLIFHKLVDKANITSADTLANSVDDFCDQLDNNGKRDQVLTAHRIFLEEYSSEVMARKYTSVYTRLCRSHQQEIVQ